MKYFLLSFATAMLLLASCKSSSKANSSTAASDLPPISLSKSSCHGRCPVFDLRISETGKMTYKGIRFVDKVGNFTAQLSPEDHKALVKLFRTQDFASLEDSYLATAKDLQLIDVVFGDKACKFHNRRAPAGVKTIVSRLDEIVANAAWKADEAPE